MKKWMEILLALVLLTCVLPVMAENTQEPSSTGDGLMPYDDVLKLIRWIDLGYVSGATYEEVVAVTGVEGLDRGNAGPNSMTNLGDHVFDWIAEEDPTHYIHVTFRGQEDTGAFVLKQWNTSGFSSSEWKTMDVTDWLIDTACREETEFTKDLQRFKNPAVKVSVKLPAKGWIVNEWGSNEIQFFKGADRNFAPRIQITVYENAGMFDFYADKFENVQPVDSRVIAGIRMNGRSYRYMDWDWTEYSAVLEDDIAIVVKINDKELSPVPGTEAYYVLESLSFSYTDKEGNEKVFDASVVPEPEVTPEPVPAHTEAPAATAEPVVTPEPSAAPAPAPTAAPVLEEGVERFAEPAELIPANWEQLTVSNERTGVTLSVYVPIGEETQLNIPDNFYDMSDHMSCDITCSSPDGSVVGYRVWGLYTTDSEREIQKYLNGADMAGEDTCTYEYIQNEYGTVMNKICKVSAGKVQYCAVSPVLADETRVILKVTMTFAPEEWDTPWFAEICEAFECTAAFTVQGMDVPGTPREETAEAVATEVPVATDAPAADADAEPAATDVPAAPGGDPAVKMGVTYRAVIFETAGVSIDASVMGEYTVLFREDGTCDFTLSGMPVTGLTWTAEGGEILLDYFGTPIRFTPTADSLDMDYFGSGILKMTEE